MDDLSCPMRALLLPAERPTLRRIARDVAQIAGLVGQLHEGSPPAHVRSVFDLASLPVSLRMKVPGTHQRWLEPSRPNERACCSRWLWQQATESMNGQEHPDVKFGLG